MRFTVFKTPKPKRFSYKPRYYDKGKAERERRKAELGYESELGRHDSLRARMEGRWRKGEDDVQRPFSRLVSYTIYAVVILGSIYFIFFTDFIDKLVSMFGIGK